MKDRRTLNSDSPALLKAASITSKSGALRWGEQVRRDIEAGKPPPQSRKSRDPIAAEKQHVTTQPQSEAARPPTLRDAVEIYLADASGRGNASSTLATKRRMLESVLALVGDCPLATFGEVEASKVRAEQRAAGLLASTINARIRLLESLLRRCHVLGLRPHPAPRLSKISERRVAVPKAYDDNAYELLVKSAARIGVEYLALVLVCGEAGLRVGEVRGLEVRDVHKDGNLRIERAVDDLGEIGPPKSGEARIVPMTARLADVLRDLSDGRSLGAPLFTNERGERLTRAQVRTRLARVQREAGLPEKGPHVLRHTCATSALAGGADVVAVQKLLGHRRLNTTLSTYLHDTGDAPQRAVEALTAARSKAEPVVTDLSRAPRSQRRARKRPKNLK